MHLAVEQNREVSAGELIVSRGSVEHSTLVSSVFEQFSGNNELEALAVVEGGRPVALITRSKLFFTLSRRFGYELHGRYPIITIADTAPLTVLENEPMDMVIDKALARPPQDMYDEIVVTRPDGSYRGLLSVKQLVIEQSEALARSVLQREMATARARELERINEVKSQFLANVTHELRSPVNVLLGLAELLKMAADKGSIELIQERLGFMMTTATNLRTVITNILDLSKIEAGRMEVATQEVEVIPLLAEIAATTRILVGNKPVIVEVLVPTESVVCTTDPIKFRQIVTNLASNAAKFTDQGRIDFTLSLGAGTLSIEVSDTGIGIREEDLQLIFNAFSQVEDAATKSREGTGLGLTISRNLAGLIGGAISVSSTYGKGTTFGVTLPLHTTLQGDTHHGR